MKAEKSNAKGLKPCPFCGGEAELLFFDHRTNAWVRCKRCEASTGIVSITADERFPRRKAIANWNRRVGEGSEEKFFEKFAPYINHAEMEKAEAEIKMACANALIYGIKWPRYNGDPKGRQ